MKGVYERITGKELTDRLLKIKAMQLLSLTEKIEISLKIISRCTGKTAILYSGGDDSNAVLRLAELSKINFIVIHNDTTIGCQNRLESVRRATKKFEYHETKPDIEPVEMWEKTGFYPLFGKRAFTARKRKNPLLRCSPVMCCYRLKEQPCNRLLQEHKINHTVWGLRADESRRRLFFFADNGAINHPKKYHWNNVSPIFHWTKKDVIDFTGSSGHKSFEAGCFPCGTDIATYPNNLSRLFVSNRDLWEFYMRSGIGDQILIAKNINSNIDFILKNHPESLLKV